MFLIQSGSLNLDEDVNTYLTSWRVPAIGDWQPRITLRQLLSHTAGFTVHGFGGYPDCSPLPTTVQVLDGEPPANSDKVEINIIPGLHYRYSGGGITVAQQVLVDLLGKPFPEIMREYETCHHGKRIYRQRIASHADGSYAGSHTARSASHPRLGLRPGAGERGGREGVRPLKGLSRHKTSLISEDERKRP